MKWRKEKGQALVEFALVLPILLMLLFGIMDFGWMFMNKLEINDTGREAARYASIHHAEPDCRAQVEALVDARVPGATVVISDDGTGITVKITKDVQVLTGVTSTFVGDTVALSVDCTMRME